VKILHVILTGSVFHKSDGRIWDQSQPTGHVWRGKICIPMKTDFLWLYISCISLLSTKVETTKFPMITLRNYVLKIVRQLYSSGSRTCGPPPSAWSASKGHCLYFLRI